LSQDKSDFIKLLIAIFGFFFSGWWTSFLLDVFNTSNIPLWNKCLVFGYILTIFITFYMVIFVEKWSILFVIFLLFDAFIVITMVLLVSAYTVLGTEPFILKILVSMVSLVMMQLLLTHCSKTIRKKKRKIDNLAT
jgi:hypothetical protein